MNYFFSLWNFQGRIGRLAYLLWGLGLFFLKYNLDRLVMLIKMNQQWFPMHYLFPYFYNWEDYQGDFQIWLYWMLPLALPFIWIGTSLTFKRLRSANLNPFLFFIFFIPILNLFFFFILCLIPDHDAIEWQNKESKLKRLIPQNQKGAFVFALFVPAILASLLIPLSVNFFKTYGWTLFVGIPFICGFTSVFLYSLRHPPSFGTSLVLAITSSLLQALIIVLLAIEGVFCIAMAAPLGAVLAMMGACIAWLIVKNKQVHPDSLMSIVLLLPLIMGLESSAKPEIQAMKVSTAMIIEAPIEKVWVNVIDFPQLPEPEHWVFKIGIAHPTHAELKMENGQLIRYCHFSTGTFKEPITLNQKPNLLQFDVVYTPPPMKELSPYKNIEAQHLDGFLESKHGEFRLEKISEKQTRITGSTWYQHKIWPETYWRIYSDYIIHRIHERVLKHIKNLSEEKYHFDNENGN